MHILLLGAGFSRNWDGWTAAEVVGDLLGRLDPHPALQARLQRRPAFEDVLATLQLDWMKTRSPEARRDLDLFQKAVVDTFLEMDIAFAKMGTLEFSSGLRFSVSAFLARFDAIFTLNQDQLLELHYLPPGTARFSGYHLPGIARQPSPGSSHLPMDQILDPWRPTAERNLTSNMQPIFKLHGSTRWRDKDDASLLVMGADKHGTIAASELLGWYMGEFKARLGQAGARLMTIGYGFADPHINDAIVAGWKAGGLRMFVVDPRGREAMNRNSGAQIPVHEEIMDVTSIGVSTRPLSHTFGGDLLSLGMLERFFAA